MSRSSVSKSSLNSVSSCSMASYEYGRWDLRFNLNMFKMLLLLMSLSGCVFLVALISIKRSKDRRALLTLLDNYELFLASKICSSFSIIQHAAHHI